MKGLALTRSRRLARAHGDCHGLLHAGFDLSASATGSFMLTQTLREKQFSSLITKALAGADLTEAFKTKGDLKCWSAKAPWAA